MGRERQIKDQAAAVRADPAHRSRGGPHDDFLRLASTVGNAAMGRLLGAGEEKAEPAPAEALSVEAEPGSEPMALQMARQRYAAPPPPAGDDDGGDHGGDHGRAAVQRFARPEHKQIGDFVHDDVDMGDGLVLTWGDLVSLYGDEFGSPEDIENLLVTGGPEKLRKILQSEGNHSPDYVDLAMRNVSHFASGGTALKTWTDYHLEALSMAMNSALSDNEEQWRQAKLNEAFAQHSLTDMFSAGHIRTPRQEIIDWYQNAFVPLALPHMLQWVIDTAEEEAAKQIAPQLGLPTPLVRVLLEGAAAYAVLIKYREMIRTKVQPLVGLGLAGAVSGALHNHDNANGLWVLSDAHPDPWLAYGDGKLSGSPVSLDQAQHAVVAAHDQMELAHSLGQSRRRQHDVSPDAPRQGPSLARTVHFAWDSAVLDDPAKAALLNAADYLLAHPEQVVDIVGHTDPSGTDAYNEALGLRRAQSAAQLLTTRGVEAGRLRTASSGKRQLLSAEKSGYALDRRVELRYRAVGEAPDNAVWARQTLAERIPGPPFPDVEQYIPREAPGLNAAQQGWKWGSLSKEMVADINSWMIGEVGDQRSTIATDPAFDDQSVPVRMPVEPGGPDYGPVTVTLNLREPAFRLFDRLLAGGADFIGQIIGTPPTGASAPPGGAPESFPMQD